MKKMVKIKYASSTIKLVIRFFGYSLLGLVCFLFIEPQSVKAFTGTIHFDCTTYNVVYGGAPACSSSTWSFNGASQGHYGNADPNSFEVAGQTIYVSYTITGTGSVNLSETGATTGTHVLLTGSQTNYSFTPASSYSITPVLSTDGGATMTNGTISNLCMSTSPTGCSGNKFNFWKFFPF